MKEGIGMAGSHVDTGETVMNHSGFLDTLKEKFSPHAVMEKVQSNKDILILMSLYVLAGFVAGFLLKKCNKFIFVVALVVAIVLLLHYQGYLSVTINWDHIQKVFGIQPVELSDGKVLPVYWQWIKDHVALVISFSVGFAFGLRIG
jgi:uncharacterized membrane protein (Fun14 family)